MLIKFLLKIWPALLPIAVYIFWVYVIEDLILRRIFKDKKTIKGEFKIVGEKSTEEDSKKNSPQKIGKFSLQNHCFVTILYMSLILAILLLIAMAFSS
jgi:hypothetical protein